MHPSDRFAAFMAHCLNEPSMRRSGVTIISVGQLYSKLLDELARRHAKELLHHSTYAWRMDADEAAARYFAATVERTIWMTNQALLTTTHRMFLALCRRAGDGWAWADLPRCKEPPAPEPEITVLLPPGTFEHVTCQLGNCSATISQGNPAAAIGARDGHPWLRAGPCSVQVPEEISMSDAITCAPPQLHILPSDAPFKDFCWTVMVAMRTANRPFGELLRLGRGLCPFDWLDELSTNQVRGLNRFLSILEKAGVDDTFESWAAAWASTPVPSFRTFEAFWNSDIGRALREPRSAMVELKDDEIDDPRESPTRILNAIEFGQRLVLLREGGVINDDERMLLEQLYQGQKQNVDERLLSDLWRRIAKGLSKLAIGEE